MTTEFIRIEQATYGEVNKGHDLIQCTFKDTKIAKTIKGYTDLFPKAPINLGAIESYISGFYYDAYYILIKTFLDKSASRSSMVFTHTLWIKKEELKYINQLEIVLAVLPTTIDKTLSLSTIQLPLSSRIKATVIEGYQRKLIERLSKGETAIWLDIATFEKAFCTLWNNLPAFGRQELKFRLSFSPDDLDFLEPNIVYTPLSSENKWEQFTKIRIQDTFESESLAEGYLLQDYTLSKALFELEEKLSHKPQTFDELRLLEQIAIRLERGIKGFTPTLGIVRLLGMYATHQESDLKTNWIKQLCQLIKNSSVHDFAKLRNLDLKPFSGYQNELIVACQEWINKSILALPQPIFKQFIQTKQSWFQTIVIHSVQDKIDNWKATYANVLWHWLSVSNSLTATIQIPNNSAIETDLVKNRIKIIEKPLAEQLLKLAIPYQWHKLHAVVVPTLFSPKKAIEKQLTIDKTTSTESLNLLAEGLPNDEFITYTLDNPNPQLINVSGQLCAKKSILLNDFDVQNKTWLAIWMASFANNTDIWKGITQPQKVVFALLDKLLNKAIPTHQRTILFEKIALSKYNNLLDYPNRRKVWMVLPSAAQAAFISRTASAWLSAFEENDSLQPESIINNYITKNINNIILNYSIRLIIKLFEINNELNQANLLVLLNKRYKEIDDPLLSKRLGKLINQKEWRKAYDKIKYQMYWNSILKFAIDECRPLRRIKLLSWLDTPYYSKGETKELIRKGIYKCLEKDDLAKALKGVKEWNEIDNLKKDHRITAFYARHHTMEEDYLNHTLTRAAYKADRSKLIFDIGRTVERW